jgi:hypothetical protein
MKVPSFFFRSLLAFAGLICAAPLLAAGPAEIAKSRDNLIVTVRESSANNPDEKLIRVGKLKAKLPDGREIEFEPAAWLYIGDTVIRFGFDTAASVIAAVPADLERLNLSNADEALAVAIANLERKYGAPVATPWTEGVMEVSGKSPDFDSSYFLDRPFWRKQLAEHPEGLAVAVPKRGGLLFAPMSDTKAVEAMKRSVSMLHATSGTMRVSSALFLFKDDKWSVLQPPAAK